MSLGAGRTSLKALLMRGWNEVPEVIGSSCMAILGLGMCAYGTWRYYANDGDNKRYKMGYIVYRPDDPRAAKVHRD